jgi:transposase
MRRPRRNHTAVFKAKVAVAALKGDKTLAELAEKFDLHANQIVQWRAQLLEGATEVFLTPARTQQHPTMPASSISQPQPFGNLNSCPTSTSSTAMPTGFAPCISGGWHTRPSRGW